VEILREAFPQPKGIKSLSNEEFSAPYPGCLLWSLGFIPILIGDFPQEFREFCIQLPDTFHLILNQKNGFGEGL
jgi:hypothetical protein